MTTSTTHPLARWQQAWPSDGTDTLLLVRPDTFDSTEAIPLGSVLWTDQDVLALPGGAPNCRYHKEFYDPIPTPMRGRVYADRCVPLTRPVRGLADVRSGDLLVMQSGSGPVHVGIVTSVPRGEQVDVQVVTFADAVSVADSVTTWNVTPAWRLAVAEEALMPDSQRTVEGLTRQATLLQQRLEVEEQRHREDMEKVGDALLNEAQRRDWCSDYDDFVDRVNEGLHIPLNSRRQEVTVTARFYSSHTVRVSGSGLEVECDVHVHYTYEGTLMARDVRDARRMVERDDEEEWLIARRDDWDFDRVEAEDADVEDEDEVCEVVGNQDADLYNITIDYTV